MRPWFCLIAILVAGDASTQPAAHDSVADFYRGKTLNIVVGHEAGTGYDFFGRMLSRHITRHMAGSPHAVPQNMPGAGGLRAANWLYNVAPKDGATMSVLAPETALKPIFGRSAATYEPAKFTWIGNMDESVATCVVSARSGITSLDQLLAREAVFGATGSAAPTSKFAYALVNFLGAKIKVVQGYKGSNNLRIALNRGEIEGACAPVAFHPKDAMERRHRQRAHSRAGAIRPADAAGPGRGRPCLRLCKIKGGPRGFRCRLRSARARPPGHCAARRAR
ncbi:MAG: hypothetical protein GEU95_20155 [Rhizobiales bacterium]|nr:hypothetical protein [Hyphomicrobiales bacterium]